MTQSITMNIYADNILDHYHHPRNSGELKNPDITHKENNPACGDELSVQLKIKGGTVKDIAWEGTGCAISIGAMSILSEELRERKTDDILKMSEGDIIKILGVPISKRRMKCATLGLEAVKHAVICNMHK